MDMTSLPIPGSARNTAHFNSTFLGSKVKWQVMLTEVVVGSAGFVFFTLVAPWCPHNANTAIEIRHQICVELARRGVKITPVMLRQTDGGPDMWNNWQLAIDILEVLGPGVCVKVPCSPRV